MRRGAMSAGLARRTLVQASVLAGILAFLVSGAASIASGASVLAAMVRACLSLSCVTGVGVLLLARSADALLEDGATPSGGAPEGHKGDADATE